MNEETKKIFEELGIENGEKAELEEFRRDKAIKENLEKELQHLVSVFPDLKAEDIPDEVFDLCENGKGLAGEYALWYLKKEGDAKAAQKTNETNSKSAPPDVKPGEEEAYFSPEAVRAMSNKEIKRNYKTIMKSMEKWDK